MCLIWGYNLMRWLIKKEAGKWSWDSINYHWSRRGWQRIRSTGVGKADEEKSTECKLCVRDWDQYWSHTLSHRLNLTTNTCDKSHDIECTNGSNSKNTGSFGLSADIYKVVRVAFLCFVQPKQRARSVAC